MRQNLLVAIVALLGTGCTAMRATTAQTELPDVNVCMSRAEITGSLGGVDEQISIPGGGRIDVHDVLIRPADENLFKAWFISIGSFGIVDLTASAIDLAYECSQNSNYSGIGAQCDYKAMRYFFHYADVDSEKPSCGEVREIWAGAAFYSVGDNSLCPTQYRAALSELIDTSDLPVATQAGPFDGISVHQHLQRMAQDHARACVQIGANRP